MRGTQETGTKAAAALAVLGRAVRVGRLAAGRGEAPSRVDLSPTDRATAPAVAPARGAKAPRARGAHLDRGQSAEDPPSIKGADRTIRDLISGGHGIRRTDCLVKSA
jgi:hypothetical protein